MDLSVPVGRPVYAVSGGTVVDARYSSSAGNFVTVDHGSIRTRYLHLSKISVKKGQRVSRGQLLGLSGNTGYSAGPHLHFDAIVQEAGLKTYKSLFATPKSDFRKGSMGYKVPIEPMLPVDNYGPKVIAGAMKQGLKLRGGGISPALVVAIIGGGGYLAWREYKKKR